jgi:hypothetical protein
MKALTAVLGTVFILAVSVVAIESNPLEQNGTAVQAAQHQHADGAKCCDKAEGMCARDGKTADGTCCKKENCCKDDCCKDGKCDKDCKCECCLNGGCCKQDAKTGNAANHKAECCNKAKAKKPTLVASH